MKLTNAQRAALYVNIDADNLLAGLQRKAGSKVARTVLRRAASHVSGVGLPMQGIFFVGPHGDTFRRKR